MYGLIHCALNEMIVESYGESIWQKILDVADVPVDSFLSMRAYDDSITYALAGATAEVLETSLEDCLDLFGQYWLTKFAPRSYELLLDAAGGELFDFLDNLDALHDRISTVFVGYVPPSFQLDRHSKTTATLNYSSSRNGMTPFVLGLIKGMQDRFDVDIHIDAVEQTETDHGDRASITLRTSER